MMDSVQATEGVRNDTLAERIHAVAALVVAEDNAREFRLDFTESSVARLDQMIDHLWGEEGPSEENVDTMVWAFGCYLAEVIDRRFDGDWVEDSDEGGCFRATRSGITLFPWHWVAERFEQGETLAYKYDVLAKMCEGDHQITPEKNITPLRS